MRFLWGVVAAEASEVVEWDWATTVRSWGPLVIQDVRAVSEGALLVGACLGLKIRAWARLGESKGSGEGRGVCGRVGVQSAQWCDFFLIFKREVVDNMRTCKR